jgi:hypothetical protein
MDELERLSLIERLQAENDADRADIARRQAEPEPLGDGLVRKNAAAGVLLYREQENARVLGAPAGEDTAPEWRSWFADTLVDELKDGASGAVLLRVINEMIRDQIGPLERRIAELEQQAERRNVVDELMKAATLALAQLSKTGRRK